MSEHIAYNSLAKLEQALDSHQSWSESLVAEVLCGNAETYGHAAADHTRCEFGKWFYGDSHSMLLTEQPLFAQLETLHRKVHDKAVSFLGAQEGEQRAAAYLEFSKSSRNLTNHLRELIQILLSRGLTTDALTGIPTRAGMEGELQRLIAVAMLEGSPACVALVDIDHFKRINDSYGHSIGDEVLKLFSQLLITSMRDSDRLYRYGGEEFLIFLNNADIKKAESALNRLREKIWHFPLPVFGKPPHLHVTASIGIAQVTADESLRTLIKRADEALYHAKETGRNRVCTTRGFQLGNIPA